MRNLHIARILLKNKIHKMLNSSHRFLKKYFMPLLLICIGISIFLTPRPEPIKPITYTFYPKSALTFSWNHITFIDDKGLIQKWDIDKDNFIFDNEGEEIYIDVTKKRNKVTDFKIHLSVSNFDLVNENAN